MDGTIPARFSMVQHSDDGPYFHWKAALPTTIHMTKLYGNSKRITCTAWLSKHNTADSKWTSDYNLVQLHVQGQSAGTVPKPEAAMAVRCLQECKRRLMSALGQDVKSPNLITPPRAATSVIPTRKR